MRLNKSTQQTESIDREAPLGPIACRLRAMADRIGLSQHEPECQESEDNFCDHDHDRVVPMCSETGIPDLELRYRAQRAILAREGLTTSDRPGSKYATTDILRYDELGEIAGQWQVYQEPAEGRIEQVSRFLRKHLAGDGYREVSVSPRERDQLLTWQARVNPSERDRYIPGGL